MLSQKSSASERAQEESKEQIGVSYVKMAEVFIATKLAEAVVSQVVQRISDLLVYEATSLSSVREEVESLRTELTRIKYFLKDADSKQEQDDRVRNWVAEVRDVACEIEDAIETYILKFHSTYIKAFHLRKLRSQINSIKDKIRSIRESRQTYQIEFSSISGEGSNSSLNKLRRSYPDDEDKDVISLKDTMIALKAPLIKEEDRLCVVSIVGMGGLGKTTLAKKVYNDVDVKKLFDSQAWVFISQQYALREVLCEILMQIGFQSQLERKNLDAKKYTKELLEERKNRRENLKDLEERELLEWVKAELDEKRYLIVLDDIWSIDAWYGIKKAFPKGKMGSKVLFTTRKMEVAKSADPYGFSIEPPLLTLEESWELLQRKAFLREQVGENSCRPEYEKVGKELVEKCRCLPLAIVVLGGLLRTKNSLEAWEKVQKDVHSHLVNKLKSDEQYSVEDILHLSFQDLPYYLKPCFLYLGCFPEDSEIRKHKLIRLWIAEGFVQMSEEEEEVRGLLIEDVAEQYLEELINRCIVQVGLRDHTGKGVKTFRLHDLMRDFCMSKSKDEAFVKTIEHNDETINRKMAVSSSCHYSSTTNSRRIAVHDNDGHLERRSPQVLEQVVHPHLRSLLCSDMGTLLILSLRNKSFLLLRVLDLDFPLGGSTKIPSEIGNLIHLRYLRLSGFRIFRVHYLTLPESIGNLRNLHTLDLRGNYFVFLRGTLSRLIHLRHVLICRYDYRPSACSRALPIMGCTALFGKHTLRNIVTLKGIYAEDLIRYDGVLELSNIRDLGISGFLSDKEVSLVFNSLGSQLICLRSLQMNFREGEFPNLEVLSHCHVLSKLTLVGGLSQENFLFYPKSLAKLRLYYFQLNQEKLAILEKLPNLRILQLTYDWVYNGTMSTRGDGYKLVFSIGGFPKLEILTLAHLFAFEDWEVEKGAMANLKRLDIQHIPKLKMIPDGLKYVTTLREFNISEMREEFGDRVRVNEDGVEGEDFYKVRRIPSISIK